MAVELQSSTICTHGLLTRKLFDSGTKLGPSVQDFGAKNSLLDRIVIWPVLIPVGAALAVSTIVSFSSALGLLAILLGVLVVCGWAISVVAAAGIAAWKKSWRRAISLVAIFVFVAPAMWASIVAGDYVHLMLALPYYETEIAALATDPKLISFHWPSAGFIPSYERNVIYDASDELAIHAGKIEPSKSDQTVSRTVRHLAGHYYLVEDLW